MNDSANAPSSNVDPHPADELDTTLQCEYVFDPESARWRARRAGTTTSDE